MSFEINEEYIGFDMIGNSNRIDKYFIMIYKPNENKKEKKEEMKKLKEEDDFLLDDEKEYTEDVIRILGKYFVKQNKNKCKIIYNNKKHKLKEYFDEIDKNYNHKIKEIKLKLVGINNITNMEQMFYGCYYLSSITEPKYEIIPTYNIKLNDSFFDIYPSSSLFEVPETKDKKEGINNNLDINYEWNEEEPQILDLYHGYNLSSVEKISLIQKIKSKCSLENSLNFNNKNNQIQNISSADINKIKNISFMFSGCISLISLPNLSEWDISNVTMLNSLFNCCSKLISIPDISKWDTSNVKRMDHMFNGCNSLKSLPDLSKWNTSNVTMMYSLFSGCNKLISIPDISNWDTSKVTNIEFMFNGCKSLFSIPDLSKWNTSNVTNINSMFQECNLLMSVPDLSKWNTVIDFF